MKNHVSRRSHLKIIPVPNDKCTVSYMSINSNSDSNSNDNVDVNVNVNVVNYTMHTVATTTLRTAFYGTWRAAIRSKTFFCTDLVSAAMPRRGRGGAVCMWFPERRGGATVKGNQRHSTCILRCFCYPFGQHVFTAGQ